jgi:outer membrane beta-barrel protein
VLSLALLIATCSALVPMRSWAQKKSVQPQVSAAPAQNGEEKVDVSDLEKKYWAAKDTDFSVVQNRLYSKAKKFELGLSYGSMLNDPWTTGRTHGLILGYYFSERWGIEYSGTVTQSTDNEAVDKLRNQSGYPDHNQVKNYHGLQVQFVPFYAKMSVLNSQIIYFDMSFALGLGMQNYVQQREDAPISVNTPALEFDVTQHFFLSKTFAVRIDLKNRWYQEETVKYRGPVTGNGSSTANTTFLMMGLALFY